MITKLHRALSRSLPLALLALLGCESIEQDAFVIDEGISPDPTAIMEGSIVYSGPRPTCVYEGGQPVRVIGNMVLNLYAYDNPPFPEGTAVSALNQLVVSGSRMFSLRDCLPEGAQPGPDTQMSSSTPFVWSRLTLAVDADVDYQIRAFYDYGEDFNPLFVARRVPTVGDVLGAARADLTDPSLGLARIRLPSMASSPNGVLYRGVTVLVDQPVVTERPAFRLGDEHRLSADAPFVPDADPVISLRRFRALTCSDPVRGNGVDCGLSVSLLPRSDGGKLAASKVRLAQDDARAYTLYADDVDLSTVVNEAIDRPGPDGRIDPHPVLGPTLGLAWHAPMVFFTRIRSADEASANIPNVRFVGTMLLDEDPPARGTDLGDGPLPVVVPPMALVEWTTPTSSMVCRVPYVAPRTPASVTAGRLAHCGDLPTGSYEVTLVSGSTGGLPGSPGASPSFQSWTVPNELGAPLVPGVPGGQVEPANVIASQSLAATFQVTDPAAEPARSNCEAQQGSVCSGSTLPVVEPEPGGGLDSATCIPPSCCKAIEHLCGLPLCSRVRFDEKADDSPFKISVPTSLGAPDLNNNNVRAPNCVPFEMPRQCCGGGSSR